MMGEAPLRLKLDPESGTALRLALGSAPEDFPSDAELERLRTAIERRAVELDLPRLRESAGTAPESLALALRDGNVGLPSAEDLSRLRAGIGNSARSRSVRPRQAGRVVGKRLRKAILLAAWLVPLAAAAAAGGYWMTHRDGTKNSATPPPRPRPSIPSSVGAADPALTIPPTPTTLPASVTSDPVESSRAPRPLAPPRNGGELDEELDLMRRVQAASKGAPAEALRLAEEHARRFPKGLLVQERELVVVESLVRLGRIEEARRLATRFEKRFPRSAHLPRIHRLTGTDSGDLESTTSRDSRDAG